MNWLSGLWRKALFSEMNPVIALGATKSLGSDDLPALPPVLEPKTMVFDEARIDWSSGPALLKSLILAGKSAYFPPLGFYLAHALLNLSGPILVNVFVTRLE